MYSLTHTMAIQCEVRLQRDGCQSKRSGCPDHSVACYCHGPGRDTVSVVSIILYTYNMPNMPLYTTCGYNQNVCILYVYTLQQKM